MAQKQIQVYLCIDEHGNYAAIGASQITDLNKNTPLSIIEDEIKKEGVNTVTTMFKVMVDLPEPKDTEEIKEAVDEKHDVSE